MSENTDVVSNTGAIDQQKLDHLMGISGELVIIRSQYARVQKLLLTDLARQKELLQETMRGRVLLGNALKEPQRMEKILTELETCLTHLEELAQYEKLVDHVQNMVHTTGSLEKASSEMQTGIVQISMEVSGGKKDTSSAMAILPALLVVVGGEICAFPLSAVTEIINVQKKDIYTVDGNTTIKLREHALSLIELSKIIEFEANAQDDGLIRRVVVVTDGENKLGVVVDSLLGKDEIVFKPLTQHFSGVNGVVGASILADGNVALILDPAKIITVSQT